MTTLPLDPDRLLDEVTSELKAVSREVSVRFGALSSEQILWRPATDRWSVADCLSHLLRVGEEYRKKLEPEIRRARARGNASRGPVRGSWFGRWFTNQMGPDKGFRARAPKVFRPDLEAGPSDAVERFLGEQNRLMELAEGARGLDLDRVRIPSPATRFVRFRATDAFRIITEHEWRHIAQARRVTGSPGFPEAR
jgi:hypothetical protein